MKIRMSFDDYTLRSNGFAPGTRWVDGSRVSTVDESGAGMYNFSVMLVDNKNPNDKAEQIEFRINLDKEPAGFVPFSEVYPVNPVLVVNEVKGKTYLHFEADLITDKPQNKANAKISE